MKEPQMEAASEQNELADGIIKRASTASAKIQQKVNEMFIPHIEKRGEDALIWLGRMASDFYHLAQNPDDEVGGGRYKGWTSAEIEELYLVLYGEELE